MKRLDLMLRCLGLLVVVVLALPSETTASFVTGGDLADCAYSGRGPEDCGESGAGGCGSDKLSCICSGDKASFLCIPNASCDPCSSPGCNTNDKHDDTTNTCDSGPCPG